MSIFLGTKGVDTANRNVLYYYTVPEMCRIFLRHQQTQVLMKTMVQTKHCIRGFEWLIISNHLLMRPMKGTY